MFESLSYLALQQYWWVIVSLLGSILVFLMFVQGGQTLIFCLSKNDRDRTLLINSLGRKWEFTFTTLVTFGGAFFASFPLFYSTSFGGAYWVWILILFAFVLQAVSFEFRSKVGNLLGARTYEIFLFLNGALGTILIGTAVATFFTGSMFSIDKMRITEVGSAISRWETPWYGLEAALNLHNLCLGLAVFFLARILAILYFMNNIDHPELMARTRKPLIGNTILFLVFFLTFVIWLMLREGFAIHPTTGEVFMESGKYLTNLLEMPIVLVLFLGGVLLVLAGIALGILRSSAQGIWYAGFGTVFTVLALLLLAGFNHTAFYPSTFDLQSSLSITNASSSRGTLIAMSYVSLFVPFVLAYIFFAWRAINNKKIDNAELDSNSHIY